MMLNLWSTYAQYFSKPFVKVIKRKSIDAQVQNSPKTVHGAARKLAGETPPQERLRDHLQKDVLLHKFNQVWHGCYDPKHLPSSEWRESEACVRVSQVARNAS